MSLVHLVAYLTRPMPGYDSVNYRVHNARGSVLPNTRQDMLNRSIEVGCTHMLFLDSDMTFPEDIVHRLLASKKRVIAANCPTKKIPSNPTARLKVPGNAGGKFVYTTDESPKLEKVWRVGTAVMLIDLDIFRTNKRLQEPSWFDMVWVPEVGKYQGEDWYFCARLEDAGIGIWVDHEVSRQIGHLGSLEYTHEMVLKEELKRSA